MKSLSSLALRLFKTNKFLVFTSITSVAIAVSLVLTMVTFAVDAKQNVENDLREMYGDLDIAIVYDTANPIENEQMLYESVLNHPSTEAVSKALVTQAYIQLLQGEVYAVGIENDSIASSRYKTTKNLSTNTVAITENLANSLNLSTNDEVEIENEVFTISEILKNAEGTGIAPDMALFTLEKASSFTDDQDPIKTTETTALMIKTKADSDLVTMANDLQTSQNDLRIDIIEQDEMVTKNLNSLLLFIVIMSLLILSVTSFMVISNFDLFIYKNKNQFAIMRVLGAKTKQLSTIISLQTWIITLSGSLLGLVFSYIGTRFLQPNLEKIFSVSVQVNNFNWEVALPVLIISMIIIQLFLYIIIIKSSKILPLVTLQNNEELDFKHLKFRKILFKILIISSIICLLFGLILAANETSRVLFILLSGFFILISLFIALPIYIGSTITRILPLVRRVFSKEVYVALQNLIPQVKKNSFVILSISILMIISIFGSTLLNSIKQNNSQYIYEQFPTSIVVNSRINPSAIDPLIFSEEVEQRIPESTIASFSNFSAAELLINENQIFVDYSLADISALIEMNLISPFEYKSLSKAMIISADFAERNQLEIGQSIDIGMYSDKKQTTEYVTTMVIEAITEKSQQGDVLFDWSADAFNNSSTTFNRIYIKSEKEKDTVQALEPLIERYPELTIDTRTEKLEEASTMFFQRWSIFIAILIGLILSVIIGIFNTLLNNIHSKRKEFAVLRTIGVRPSGILKIILAQVCFYVITGLIYGSICGFILTFIVSLVDPSGIVVNFVLLGFLSIGMLVGFLILFIPIGWKLGKQKISLEILNDNK